MLETGETYQGLATGAKPGRAGEVVFNTSHSGYEEIATDPSYYSQIVVMTAPMQGNYGSRPTDWENPRIWIEGFIALEVQESGRDRQWRQALAAAGVPVLDGVDTREITMRIRSGGNPWGAIVNASDADSARAAARPLIEAGKLKPKDWCYAVSTKETRRLSGMRPSGPRVAILDFGCKENIIRETQMRASAVAVMNSRSSMAEILDFKPDTVLLSNGPGDPADVQTSIETIRSLFGKVPVFGICMGHQLLCLALGGKTYRLPFGHRGGNHPVQDTVLGQVYMTSQNHGYAVDSKSLPPEVEITHRNLYDGTVEGLRVSSKNLQSVQFHPESAPGPREAAKLFDLLVGGLAK